MISIFTIFFLTLGLTIGSFLNVVIYRLGTHRSLGGRSACLSCQKVLSWFELVPFFSFIFLSGRCRSCKSRISVIYPAVELITGFVFTGIYLKFQEVLFFNPPAFLATFSYYATAFSLLVVISFYDLRHKIVPDSLALSLGILSFLGLFLFDGSGFHLHLPSLFEFLSGPLIAVPFALFWLVSKGVWMGLGDAKLILSMGWLIGISRALSAAVLSFWSGAVFGIMLILFSGKHGLKSEIPFAPFLAFSAIVAFLFELHIFPFF
ncbi:hypothetical protein A3D42_01430 [Candidatus Nomurabacteria bacterium RIFCSPHIGHO2_02_FULL_41_18]|uniref:Peptidase A24A N-terminal domain-containing protein n=1 Tax=Candidatus Nomurabacteria bacterium RIFCSPHIGHO2_02_FULL_41_18 TaxID=1801754 RepID=A0A1F6W848_9BACT|nr:MAG: hypothetical protein A2737_00370 [Candidatus Nomurabacteria bacterium RIFCSPHIGHO2_01_FULL_41_71]OGI77855.1 MAG: hypothetical protein A3D42_01430 [Candidatus Nomurabacteria bacterium RIFCSPHIGHO2_02_FULL_41_18]OGI90041.1 MAG: hypothetical protein A3B01_02200 [Candidatus Nomurabacteria bacterium RIFCSPLOWO2_01_FULL_41_52b]